MVMISGGSWYNRYVVENRSVRKGLRWKRGMRMNGGEGRIMEWLWRQKRGE